MKISILEIESSKPIAVFQSGENSSQGNNVESHMLKVLSAEIEDESYSSLGFWDQEVLEIKLLSTKVMRNLLYSPWSTQRLYHLQKQ